VNRGAWASALDPDELPCLLALACVAGPAQESGISTTAQLVVVLTHLLEPEKGRPDEEAPKHPNPKRALALLLGTAETTRGYNSAARRERTRDYLYGTDGMDLDTFNRRHVQPLLGLLADELVEYDRKYRMRDTHERLAGKLPASPALAVLWLDRFQYYYRMWSDLSGITNDLAVYLRVRHDPPPPTASWTPADGRPCGSWLASTFTLISSWTSGADYGCSAMRSKPSSCPIRWPS
jgi:hypothetical protein